MIIYNFLRKNYQTDSPETETLDCCYGSVLNFASHKTERDWHQFQMNSLSIWVYLDVKTCEVFLCFVTIMFVLSIVLTSLFSLFYVTRERNRFLHRG